MKTLKVGEREYKIRLTAYQISELESREKKSIAKLFNESETISVIDPIVKIIHASLVDKQPEITLKETYDIYQDLVEKEKYDIDKFLVLIESILTTAGLTKGGA